MGSDQPRLSESGLKVSGDAPSLRESLTPELEADLALLRKHWLGDWKADDHGQFLWAGSRKGGDDTPAQVRGWGYLTGKGHGALGLPDADAIAVQRAVARVIAAGVNALLSTGNRKDGSSQKDSTGDRP
jgi:hypothetical protein